MALLAAGLIVLLASPLARPQEPEPAGVVTDLDPAYLQRQAGRLGGAVIGILCAGALAAAAAVWILVPLFRADAAQAERASRLLSTLADLQSEREMALSALRDLEDDRATGKISDADYEALKARFTERAMEVLKKLDEAEAASAGLVPFPARARSDARPSPAGGVGPTRRFGARVALDRLDLTVGRARRSPSSVPMGRASPRSAACSPRR